MPIASTSLLCVSSHSVERYQERVDPTVSFGEARLALIRFVALGRRRPTPRWWMRNRVRRGPGVSFCYYAAQPEACAIVVDSTVVTVVTRSMFVVQSGERRRLRVVPDDRRPVTEDRQRWRWNGELPAIGLEAA